MNDPAACTRFIDYRITTAPNDPNCSNYTGMGTGQPPEFAISYDTRQRPNGSYCVVCVATNIPQNPGPEVRIQITINNGGNLSAQDRDAERSARGPFAWTSRLDSEDAAGQVVVDGTRAFYVRAQRHAAMDLGPGAHRIEAQLVDAERPGVWEFQLDGSVRSGSLRPLGGTVVRVTDRSIAFRLKGSPGERFVFEFEIE